MISLADRELYPSVPATRTRRCPRSRVDVWCLFRAQLDTTTSYRSMRLSTTRNHVGRGPATLRLNVSVAMSLPFFLDRKKSRLGHGAPEFTTVEGLCATFLRFVVFGVFPARLAGAQRATLRTNCEWRDFQFTTEFARLYCKLSRLYHNTSSCYRATDCRWRTNCARCKSTSCLPHVPVSVPLRTTCCSGMALAFRCFCDPSPSVDSSTVSSV